MPCDAVATVSGAVDAQAVAALLESEQGLAALKMFLAEQTGVASALESYRSGNSLIIYGGGIRINLMADGRLSVSHYDSRQAAALSKALEAFLPQLKGALLQARVGAILRQRYLVTDEQSVAGATVFTVEV